MKVTCANCGAEVERGAKKVGRSAFSACSRACLGEMNSRRRLSREEAEKRFSARIGRVTSAGCWVWTGKPDSEGYGRFKLCGEETGAHRAAYRLFVGEIPDGLFVCHHCDNKVCVNPSHFFLGTSAENIRDCVAKGRQPKGTAKPDAKLDDEIVRTIRASSLPTAELSQRYGVSKQNIWAARTGRSWRHVA